MWFSLFELDELLMSLRRIVKKRKDRFTSPGTQLRRSHQAEAADGALSQNLTWKDSVSKWTGYLLVPRSVLDPVNERLKALLCSSPSNFRNLSSSSSLLNDSSVRLFSPPLHQCKRHCKMTMQTWSKKAQTVFKECTGEFFLGQANL